MSNQEYAEKLLDHRWIAKRDSIIERDISICHDCYSKGPSHVHHLYYIYGREPWDYPDDALITLCPRCHSLEHGKLYQWNASVTIPSNLKRDGLRVIDFYYLFPELEGNVMANGCADEIITQVRILRDRRDKNYAYLIEREKKYLLQEEVW